MHWNSEVALPLTTGSRQGTAVLAARLRRLAPLPRLVFVVGAIGRSGEVGRAPRPTSAPRPSWSPVMSDDAELGLFRHGLNFAALLEQIGCGWKLDQRESTRRALK